MEHMIPLNERQSSVGRNSVFSNAQSNIDEIGKFKEMKNIFYVKSRKLHFNEMYTFTISASIFFLKKCQWKIESVLN
jgi:hypothetical protein